MIRRAAGVAARSLNGTEAVITTLSDIDLEAAIEGLILGRLPVQRLPQRQDRTEGQGPARDHRADAPTRRRKTKAAAERATAIATAVATARDLVNTPPVHLYPAEFAKRAKALGEAAGLEVEVLDDKALAKDGLRRHRSASARARRARRGWSG